MKENPSSEVITRKCGHTQTFTPMGDQWDDQRRAKLLNRVCSFCGRAKNIEHNIEQTRRAKGKKDKKPHEMRALPEGSQAQMWKLNGIWSGNLVAEEISVSGQASGMKGLAKVLTANWLEVRRIRLNGQVAS
jgi:hypothetical protein